MNRLKLNSVTKWDGSRIAFVLRPNHQLAGFPSTMNTKRNYHLTTFCLYEIRHLVHAFFSSLIFRKFCMCINFSRRDLFAGCETHYAKSIVSFRLHVNRCSLFTCSIYVRCVCKSCRRTLILNSSAIRHLRVGKRFHVCKCCSSHAIKINALESFSFGCNMCFLNDSICVCARFFVFSQFYL